MDNTLEPEYTYFEPTQEEIIVESYDPTQDSELRNTTIILPSGVNPKGEGWKFSHFTPVKKHLVYKNELIERQNDRLIYNKSTTASLRGLIKTSETINMSYKSSWGRQQLYSRIIQFCNKRNVDGTICSLARYIQENCYKEFIDYIISLTPARDVHPDKN